MKKKELKETILPFGVGLASFVAGSLLGIQVGEEIFSELHKDQKYLENMVLGLNTGLISSFTGFLFSKNWKNVSDEIKILPYEITGAVLGYSIGEDLGTFISRDIFTAPRDPFPFANLGQGIQDEIFSLAGTLLAIPTFYLGRRLGKRILREYRELYNKN